MALAAPSLDVGMDHGGRTNRGPYASSARQKAGQKQGKGAHKRQISEAIPRAEREVARVPQEVVAEAVGDGLRKSVRPRKPKSRS